MAIYIKLEKCVNETKSSYGKYYARTVYVDEIHTADIAEIISRNSTFKSSDVLGVLKAMEEEMQHQLQDGKVVVLDGIGRFRLVAESTGVAAPSQFSIRRCIKAIRCKFLPAGTRDKQTLEISRGLCEGTTVAWTPGGRPSVLSHSCLDQ